jgi:methyl coenzyme M reductase gamma subunit
VIEREVTLPTREGIRGSESEGRSRKVKENRTRLGKTGRSSISISTQIGLVVQARHQNSKAEGKERGVGENRDFEAHRQTL